MTKTEKLREKLGGIEEYDGEWSAYFPLADETVELILRVCQESGLRFVDLPSGYTDEGIKGIEL